MEAARSPMSTPAIPSPTSGNSDKSSAETEAEPRVPGVVGESADAAASGADPFTTIRTGTGRTPTDPGAAPRSARARTSAFPATLTPAGAWFSTVDPAPGVRGKWVAELATVDGSGSPSWVGASVDNTSSPLEDPARAADAAVPSEAVAATAVVDRVGKPGAAGVVDVASGRVAPRLRSASMAMPPPGSPCVEPGGMIRSVFPARESLGDPMARGRCPSSRSGGPAPRCARGREPPAVLAEATSDPVAAVASLWSCASSGTGDGSGGEEEP